MEEIEIQRLREKLELQRHEVLQFLRQLEQEKHSLEIDVAQDSADRCILNVTRESLFERSSQQRTVLRLIDAALGRIADASFGICIGCGEEIQSRRLEALPWTQFCLRCQGELEQEVHSTLSATTLISATETWKRAG
jgi:DnaK suppressor protein